ncbi:hypothetical protein ABT213_10755 [Streptomyces sp. NPDC001674]|uniref:hypothetical protein n=1 Tax=Streptomyces sp. NPDC001674 TaxID=3154394 RepID=UPI00333295D8
MREIFRKARSTVLRLVEGVPDPQPPAPRVVGVDEYATRRGRAYGTVLVDAEGATAGAPQAVQVADRRHLWHNLGEAAERAVTRHRQCLHATTPLPSRAVTVDPQTARRTSISPGRQATGSPTGPGRDRWNEGCTNAWKLWEETVPLGYKGSHQRVGPYLRRKRTSPRPVTAQPPSPRTVASWILRRPTAPSEAEQLQPKTVLANCPELDALTRHVHSFALVLTERQGEWFPEWFDAVRQDDLPSPHTLAAGIDRDRDAVIAGLTLPWNSGVVQGHVNRIKMLKRQMFGRAGFMLLRKRVLLAS